MPSSECHFRVRGSWPFTSSHQLVTSAVSCSWWWKPLGGLQFQKLYLVLTVSIKLMNQSHQECQQGTKSYVIPQATWVYVNLSLCKMSTIPKQWGHSWPLVWLNVVCKTQLKKVFKNEKEEMNIYGSLSLKIENEKEVVGEEGLGKEQTWRTFDAVVWGTMERGKQPRYPYQAMARAWQVKGVKKETLAPRHY